LQYFAQVAHTQLPRLEKEQQAGADGIREKVQLGQERGYHVHPLLQMDE
jgi:hypothetical protein